MQAPRPAAIVLLAKQPLAGRSKTRLAKDVGVAGALLLAEAFVLDTLATAGSVEGADLIVAHAPDSAATWFRGRAPGARLVAQPEGDLGARMRAAIQAALGEGAERVVVVGMDTPHLRADLLRHALTALDRVDVVLGPSLDGGYYLIGVQRDEPSLFSDIPWSTGDVLGITLARAAAARRSAETLEPEFDIDDGQGLDLLRTRWATEPEAAPCTRAALGKLLGG